MVAIMMRAAPSALIKGMPWASSKTSKRTLSLRVRAEAEKPVESAPTAGVSTTPEAAAPMPSTPAAPKVNSPSFGEAMAFSGPIPEVVNGRLCMVAVIAAIVAEMATGESVLQQFSDAPVPIILFAVTFIAASLIPVLKGVKAEAFGPLTPAAELLNSRAAMIGFASLISIELFKGSALF